MRLTDLRAAAERAASSPRLRRRAAWSVVLVLAAVLGFRGLRGGGVFDAGRSNDFAAFHAAARGVAEGDIEPAYSARRPYQYPPTLGVLIAPLGLLPYRAAAAVWTIGNLALLILAARRLGTALGPPVGLPESVLGCAFAFRMAESDFANGNANTLILALLVLALAECRRGRDGAGGALIGLAAAIKLTPAFLLAWALARRRWRLALGFVAGAGIAGAAFPAAVLGPGSFARGVAAFRASTLRPIEPGGDGYGDEAPGGYIAGQSLRALLHRLLRPIDATAHDEREVAVNVASLPKGAVDALWAASAAGVFGLLAWRFRRSGAPWGAGEAGAALAAMALLSPLSRKAHFVVLAPAAAAAFAAARALSGWRRRAALAAWGAAFALAALTAPAILGKALAAETLAWCPLSIAAALLIAVCAAPATSAGTSPGCTSPAPGGMRRA